MRKVIVIPARFHSTRLPGKPLIKINGKSMIFRIWSLAKNIQNIDEVFITTDDYRIKSHAEEFGAKVIMTDSNCSSGTDRVFMAVSQLDQRPEIIVNFQGDAVLTPPSIVQNLVDFLLNNLQVGMATLAVRLNWKQYDELVESKIASRSSGTTVIFDKDYNALYFSKNIIPHMRKRDESMRYSPVFKHVGMYGYRYETLKDFVSFNQTIFEKTESLEQLRALENGVKIKVVVVDTEGRTLWSVDNQEDVGRVERIIVREGELVNF